MVVTCPHCAKRYMLDEALLPQEGRQVRCIACNHVWRQVPDIAPHAHSSPLHGRTDMALQMKAAPRRSSCWMGWSISIMAFIIFMSVLIFGRNQIVAYWPESEKYYALVGLQITHPGAGLSILNASSQVLTEASGKMLQVMGTVSNTSDSIRLIAPLKIKLIGHASHPACVEKDEEGACVLDRWEHRLSEQSLLPGEKIQFETDPRPISEGAQHVHVEF